MFATVSIDEARAYQQRRRNFPPARYNYGSRWLSAKGSVALAGQNLSTLSQFASGSNSGNLNVGSSKNQFQFRSQSFDE